MSRPTVGRVSAHPSDAWNRHAGSVHQQSRRKRTQGVIRVVCASCVPEITVHLRPSPHLHIITHVHILLELDSHLTDDGLKPQEAREGARATPISVARGLRHAAPARGTTAAQPPLGSIRKHKNYCTLHLREERRHVQCFLTPVCELCDRRRSLW